MEILVSVLRGGIRLAAPWSKWRFQTHATNPFSRGINSVERSVSCQIGAIASYTKVDSALSTAMSTATWPWRPRGVPTPNIVRIHSP